jgi:uncharacterized protein (DUF1330 family)
MRAQHIEPTATHCERLAAVEGEEPVVMLNLLRFKERADGIDAADGISGAEAYARYGAAATQFLAGVGGRVLWVGVPQQSVIGPEALEWDLVIAAEYPSPQAFLAMTSNPDYVGIHGHRAAALADSRLIACKPFAT